MSISRRIKLLQCIRQGQIGGGESHLLSLMEHIDRSRFEPVVLSFTPGPMVERLERMGIRTKVIPSGRPFDFRQWKKIKQWIREEKFDLIHAHGTRAHSNVSWVARSLKIPLVYSIHGWSFHDNQPFIIKQVRIWGERYLTRRSSLNISVSHSNQATGRQCIKGFHSWVIPNGINLKRFQPAISGTAIRSELAIPVDAVVVLFLARFTLQKQPLELIRAFERAAKQNPHLFLLMIGDGEQKAAAQELLPSLEGKDRILLLPFRSDVPQLLASADMFVLPSLWEGLPIALLEAMAMGKAIIATRVDGTRDLLRHRENGYLVDPACLHEELVKGLLEVSKNFSLRTTLEKKARATVLKGFDAIQMTQKIQTTYDALLDRQKHKQMKPEFDRISDIKRLHFIAETLSKSILPQARVLDVGCGNGVIARHLGQLGYSVLGIDVSETAVATARSLNRGNNVCFEVMSAEELTLKGQQFDAVICSEVLEHLHQPAKLLAALYPLLEDTGILIVTVPNGRGPRELLVTKPIQHLRVKNNWLWKSIQFVKQCLGYNGTTVQSAAEDLTHIQFFTKSSLEQLARDTSFHIVRFGKTNFVEDVFPISFFSKRFKLLQKLDCALAEKLPCTLNGGFVTAWKKR